jgi:hypothetical protein
LITALTARVGMPFSMLISYTENTQLHHLRYLSVKIFFSEH